MHASPCKQIEEDLPINLFCCASFPKGSIPKSNECSRVSQFLAYHISIFLPPVVITDSTPGIVVEHLHPSLMRSTASSETYLIKTWGGDKITSKVGAKLTYVYGQ